LKAFLAATVIAAYKMFCGRPTRMQQDQCLPRIPITDSTAVLCFRGFSRNFDALEPARPVPVILRERLQRTLGVLRAPSRFLQSFLVFGALAAIAIVAAVYHRNPDLSHVNVAFLSGSERGNYYAVVSKLAAEAKQQRGRIGNIPTAGSIDNVTRLAAAKSSCNAQFALVQDGMPWPEKHPFELIGRLPTPEVFVVLGRNGDRIRSVADLRGKRIGIGPARSGTEHVARQIMAELSDLDVKVSNHPLDEQLAKAESGELDFAAMVIDPDAQLLVEAVRDRKLQIVDIEAADALAHRLPFARAGKISVGYYDPVRQFPSSDKHVIQIDTLVVGNGCARESVTQGVITAIRNVFPDFVRANKERATPSGLPFATAARSYFDNDGPDPVGEHVPLVIDIMPTARWLQLIFAFSLLFGAQAVWHRFRLWRIDARRVRIEGDVARLFAPGITVGEIASIAPDEQHRGPKARAQVDAIVDELGKLGDRCRRQSLSILVPMGQEMGYRYQESLIADLVHALKKFREKI
jgi:TRAP-type uncharacterized transport system substrate-binding protein